MNRRLGSRPPMILQRYWYSERDKLATIISQNKHPHLESCL